MCHLRRLVQSDASGCRAVHEISLTRILSYASAFDRNYLPITPNMASNAASIVTDSRLVAATKARSGDAQLTSTLALLSRGHFYWTNKLCDVRFRGQSGHRSRIAKCPLLTLKSGHVQCTKPCNPSLLCAKSGHEPLYSITSSAIAAAGRLRAVLFLLTILLGTRIRARWLHMSIEFSHL